MIDFKRDEDLLRELEERRAEMRRERGKLSERINRLRMKIYYRKNIVRKMLFSCRIDRAQYQDRLDYNKKTGVMTISHSWNRNSWFVHRKHKRSFVVRNGVPKDSCCVDPRERESVRET